MKKVVVRLVALLFSVLPLTAQSNTVIDALLDSREAAFGDAAYLALSAARIIPEKATPDDAVWALQARDLGVAGRSAKEPITLGEYSFLLMKVFGMRGERVFPTSSWTRMEYAGASTSSWRTTAAPTRSSASSRSWT